MLTGAQALLFRSAFRKGSHLCSSEPFATLKGFSASRSVCLSVASIPSVDGPISENRLSKPPLLTEELNGTTEASEVHVASLAQSRPFKSHLALLRWLLFSAVLRIETREPQSLFTISITKSSK